MISALPSVPTSEFFREKNMVERMMKFQSGFFPFTLVGSRQTIARRSEKLNRQHLLWLRGKEMAN